MGRNRGIWTRFIRHFFIEYIMYGFVIGNIAVILECSPVIEVIKVQNNNSEILLLVEPLIIGNS